MQKYLLAFVLSLTSLSLQALSGIIESTTDKPIDQTYDLIYQQLESHKFWVVFEANMGSRLEKMQKKWGDDYNKNNLTGIRSMVFCNINWTHKLANADPKSLVLCPLHITLYEQDKTTHILMPKFSQIVKSSTAQIEVIALEQQLVNIIHQAIGR